MKPQNTKPILSVCAKMFTAVLMIVAAAAVTLGLSARTVQAAAEASATLAVGQSITFDASDYSKVKSRNSKVLKVTKENGKYIATAIKAGSFKEDEKAAEFGQKYTSLDLYKKGKLVLRVEIDVYNKGKLLYTGKSMSYKTSAYSKVTSDDSKILKVTKKKGKYVVTAKKEGTTLLRLYKKGKLSKVLCVMSLKKSTCKVKTSTITVKKGEKITWKKMCKKLELKTETEDYYWSIHAGNFSILPTKEYVFHAEKTGKTTLILNLMDQNFGCIVKTCKVTLKVK